MKKPSVILFDVNETLIDLQPLKEKVNTLLGANGFAVWFEVLLHYSLVDNCTGSYHNFTDIAEAAFTMAAAKLQKKVSDSEAKDALSVLVQCKAHPDVLVGLEKLQSKGFRLGALTNSPGSTLMKLLQNNALEVFFEKALSVDEIKKYKPAPETYLWAAREFGVAPEDCLLIACHAWDITGAAHAGLQTGFIEREGQVLYPLGEGPDYKGKDLLEVAKALE